VVLATGLCARPDDVVTTQVVADHYAGLRDKWVEAAFMGGDKAAFGALVKEQMRVFEALYAKYAQHDYFLKLASDGMPLWGDYCLASFIRDLKLTGFLAESDLPPRVKKMYDALISLPDIANWIADKEGGGADGGEEPPKESS